MKYRGILLGVVSVNLMALAPVINKFALSYMTAVQASLLNTIFVLLFTGIYLRLRGTPFRLSTSKLLWGVGLFDGLGVVCLYLSIDLIGPVTVGFLGRFYTIFAIGLAAVVLKERLTAMEILVIIFAIVGAFAFVHEGFEQTAWIGVIVALVYTLFFALSNMLAKLAVSQRDSLSILFHNKIVALLLIAGYALLAGELRAFPVSSAGVGLVLLVALISNLLGLLCFYEGLRYIDFTKANIIRSIEPIAIALFSWPFFPITLDRYKVIGAMILLGSTVWLARQDNKEPAPDGERPPVPVEPTPEEIL